MNDSDLIESRIAKMGRSSRRAALVSLLGFLLVLGAIVYAAVQLQNLDRQRKVLETEQEKLKSETVLDQHELQQTRNELAQSRSALSAARAAINAFHSGNLDEALTLYNEALASDPNNGYLQNLRAYTLFRLGRVNEALDGERLSIAADPSYAWGYFDLARFECAASPSQMQNAREAVEEALRLRPDLRAYMKNDGEFQRVCKHQLP